MHRLQTTPTRTLRAMAALFMLGLVMNAPPVRAASATATIPEALPGAEPFGNALRTRLASRLAAFGSDYVPRTQNLDESGAPHFTNRLLFESSPYLRQHAHNPVNWHAWGDEPFVKAKRLGRPVLVSIGYSTCHWCHVMEEESFDDRELARYLNANFIAIKIDREVRPDLDAIYMAAVHALGIRGGWPLNVFLTPERKPFYGGTYFPPTPRGGRASFRQTLESIATHFEQNRDDLEQRADQIAEHIRRNLEGTHASSSQGISSELIPTLVQHYLEEADPEWGGLNRTPKFPSSLPIRLLLRYAHRTGDQEPIAVANLALEKMARGGMHDQVGGGFHRYSTDRRWLVPHFEKMLYDNALLAQDYLEAWQKTNREEFAEVCNKTLRYVAREMTADSGAFYSATDADSKNLHGETEEGYFFTWTRREIAVSVGWNRAAEIDAYYGVTSKGNFEGRNIFAVWRDDEAVASELGISVETLQHNLETARKRLYEVRDARQAPLLDDKILVSWNGLMISAFARAGFAFSNDAWLGQAKRAADFLLTHLVHEGRLLRVYKDGVASGPAFLEDHAFLIKGLLDLYEADGDPRWLRQAITLQDLLDRHYRDTAGGGYFKTADDAERLIAREKPGRDGAIPSGNSIAAMNLLRLHTLTSNPLYLETVDGLMSSFEGLLQQSATTVTELVNALDYRLDTPKEIVIVAKERGPALDAMLLPLRSAFLPNRTLSTVIEGQDAEAHAALSPLVKGKRAQGGRVTAYVCENQVCKYPTSSPEEFAKQFGKVRPYPQRTKKTDTSP